MTDPNIYQLSFTELKKKLKEQNLSTIGSKADLIYRLQTGVKEKEEQKEKEKENKEEQSYLLKVPDIKNETVNELKTETRTTTTIEITNTNNSDTNNISNLQSELNFKKRNKPLLCLNLIVKDEEKVIVECIESIARYIDTYVILDTGSTDNTVQVIRDTFAKFGIEGQIHFQPAVSRLDFDFGKARTRALELCRDVSDWVWVIDADNLIVGDFSIREKLLENEINIINEEKRVDAYYLPHKWRRESSKVAFWREQIFRNVPELGWKYTGFIHEYLGAHPENENIKVKRVKLEESSGFVLDRRLGSRNLDPFKSGMDALCLEKSLLQDPTNARNVYYAANSWYEAGNYEFALIRYKQRIKMKDFWEEIYDSKYKIALCMKYLGKSDDRIINALLDVYNYHSSRAEPLYQLALLYENQGEWSQSYEYARRGVLKAFPKEELLWKEIEIYDYEMRDLLARAAYYVGNYSESVLVYNELLSDSTIYIPEQRRSFIRRDAQSSLNKLETCKSGYKQLKHLLKDEFIPK